MTHEYEKARQEARDFEQRELERIHELVAEEEAHLTKELLEIMEDDDLEVHWEYDDLNNLV